MTRHDGLDILATGDAGFRSNVLFKVLALAFNCRQLSPGIHLYIGNLDAIANEVMTLHLFILAFVSRATGPLTLAQCFRKFRPRTVVSRDAL